MHAICEREAIRLGPRAKPVNGTVQAVYCLTREELHKIFIKNGFRRDGVAWLKMVISFRDTWDEIAPDDKKILNPNDTTWIMVFTHVSEKEYMELQFFAEENSLKSLAVVP